jgi:hypothetical protein
MAGAVLGVLLTVVVLATCVMAAPVCGQSLAWWDVSPQLIPPSDVLVPREDAFDLPPAPPIPLTVSLGRWLEADSSVGFDVTRLRPDLGLSRLALGIEPTAGTAYRFIDSNLQQTAVSVDLKLVWPSPRESGAGLLQPYLAFGPAVFVAERNPFANPLGTLADVAVRVGLKAGAGISWQFDTAAALFGEYRIMRGTDSPLLSSGGRLGPGSGASGYDLLYGLRLRF